MAFVSIINRFTTCEKQTILWAINFCLNGRESKMFGSVPAIDVVKYYLGIRSIDESAADKISDGFKVIMQFTKEQQYYFATFVMMCADRDISFFNQFLMSCGFTDSSFVNHSEEIASEMVSFYKHFKWTEKEYDSQFDFDYHHIDSKNDFWSKIDVEGRHDAFGLMSFWITIFDSLTKAEQKSSITCMKRIIQKCSEINGGSGNLNILNECQDKIAEIEAKIQEEAIKKKIRREQEEAKRLMAEEETKRMQIEAAERKKEKRRSILKKILPFIKW